MGPELLTIQDYDKGNVSAGICVDVLLASIEQSHPSLYTLLESQCGDILTDEEVIDVLREIIK